MYYDREFKGVRNKDLANLFLDELSKTIPLETRYITEKKKDEIYILKKAVVPAVLIEVGYITNNSDMKYLSKEENRKAAAQGIYNGIMKAYEMYPPTDGELREAE
jgi:N-acetylmuramoyl-L-alanine amidase